VSPIQVAEPLGWPFAGVHRDASLPLALIVGVGYEPDRALGVFDSIECSASLVFVPIGPDPRYLADVLTANQPLLDVVGQQGRVDYDLNHPLDVMQKLASVCGGLVNDHRIIVVPMGPKIFALCTLLVAWNLQFAASVWRVSSGD